MRARLRPRFASPRRADMDTALLHYVARIGDGIEPLIAGESRSRCQHEDSGADRCCQRQVRAGHINAELSMACTAQTQRRCAKPDIHRQLSDVTRKSGSILARSFSRPPEQSLIRIGAAPCHPAERQLRLNEDGTQAIIKQP